MSLHRDFEHYLSHLGPTVPVSALHSDPYSQGLCALRHDVDHDLDIALEMANREHEMGVQATYFILPSAPYWDDPRLIDKCLQLQDYGHEVGLHVNSMAEWAAGAIDDPEEALRTQLARLRGGGVTILGISAHGDRRCYENNVSNYWCFQELQPADPRKTENGRTAEGPFEADGRSRLTYPESGEVVRSDGARQCLWSISMASLGLNYHAWHTPFDRYFSDSGGTWTRTPPPLDSPRGNERWQVLMHPVHWQGASRRYFFLSTARSGSRWLTEVLDQATPLKARHEYILNQDFHRGEAAQKATACFRALEDDPDTVRTRLSEAWEELEQLKNDYAEANVYLPSFVEELRRCFPDAVFVHLHRHPALVVRSIMERDWYDTPEDHAHPRLQKADAADLNRFERVCQYVAETNERLLEACDERVALEDLTNSPEALRKAFKRLGIPYHRRLGDHLVTKVLNATQSPNFPSPEEWDSEKIESFQRLTGTATQALGYQLSVPANGNRIASINKEAFYVLWRWAIRVKQMLKRLRRPPCSEIKVDSSRIYGAHCDVSVDTKGFAIRPHANGNHAYLSMGGSRWQTMTSDKREESGWMVYPEAYIRGDLEVRVPQGGSVTIFAISYGEDRKQIYRRKLGCVDSQNPTLEFSFAPHPESKAFDIMIYLPASRRKNELVLKHIQLQRRAHRDSRHYHRRERGHI